MARYLAHDRIWLSHESRLVEAGETFETTFPKHMKFGSNIEPLDKKRAPKPAPEPMTSVDPDSAEPDQAAVAIDQDDNGGD
jgi:hypothetical protein